MAVLILFLAKSLGAFLIALVIAPVVLLAKRRMHLLIAAGVAGLVMTYPIMRTADLVPVNAIIALAENIDPARAASFQTRVDNEDQLLAHAKERPWFGWGGWGRNRIYHKSGKDISLTDGAWVIEMGVGGWFRYIAIFGLFCLPIIVLFMKQREKVDSLCAVLALVLSTKLLDLLPNSGMPAIYCLIAGSLIGRLEMKQGNISEVAAAREASITTHSARRGYGFQPPKPAYARTFPSSRKDIIDPAEGFAGQEEIERPSLYRRSKPVSGARR